MESHNWRTLAAQRFIGAAVYGRGRFAVVSCDKKSVWLCETEANAHGAALGACHLSSGYCRCEHEILDLTPRSCPLPRKERKDDYEDREWLRRQSNS